MSVISVRRTSKIAPFLGLALLAGACQSTTGDKGAATGKNITRAADEIQTGIGQLDATVAALTQLVNEPGADLAPQFKSFSKSLDQLDATAKSVRESTAAMEANGKAYFAEWDKQLAAIHNEDIRERSEERRKAVEARLSEIKEEYQAARDAFHPLMADFKDIRTALEADLTMSGLDAVKKSVKKTNDKAEDVKESLTQLAESFHKVGVSLSKVGPAPQPAKTEKK